MNVKQIRDLTILTIDENRYLGIACDSCGGIGNKEYDVIKATPQLTAYQTAKVVFAELLSMGFEPVVLADGLAVEMNDTGKQLIEGFNEAINKLSSCKVHLTGSTEENVKTVQTSMGVTCIGICNKDKLKYKKTLENDICLLLGLPLVGMEVINNPNEVLDISDFEKLYLSNFIKEILPVGSRGIRKELKDLCDYNNLNFEFSEFSIDIDKSGGPSCCCLVTIDKADLDKTLLLLNKPAEILGKFIK